ncbi:hypothetical protein Aph01nite_76850 [Acrocarpospora phusangensis]|uniref:Uncharacterized protein n=1 Tax=Acrocarpospora phusangensis TaxID=1070424 RepID=A0A919UVF8_9ACTN|nr:hypothetical protein [Acrocarpospora phusangensis]GIH29375.1 hypothetical protein Aph01nite_76850 [Acrocarpospora phusangensis]
MSGSEEYLRDLVESQDIGDWSDVVREIAEELGGGATRFLAGLTGRGGAGRNALRSPERWVNRATDKINPRTGELAQASTPKPADQKSIIEGWKLRKAADHLRRARKIKAGDIRARYAGQRDAWTRRIGDLGVDKPGVADGLTEAAELLEQGDYAGAAEALDTAVIEGYEAENIEVDDYEDGFEVE